MNNDLYGRKRKRGGVASRAHVQIKVQRAEARRIADIHSHVRGNASHNLKGTSATAVIEGSTKYYACAEVEETVKDHIVPRQSVTRKQLLMVFPQQRETESMPCRQLDKREQGKHATVQSAVNVGTWHKTTDLRTVWKSDRTLLRRDKPESKIGTFKREGSVKLGLDKRRNFTTEQEIPITDEVIQNAIGVELDKL